jgi:hypothetical protein
MNDGNSWMLLGLATVGMATSATLLVRSLVAAFRAPPAS